MFMLKIFLFLGAVGHMLLGIEIWFVDQQSMSPLRVESALFWQLVQRKASRGSRCSFWRKYMKKSEVYGHMYLVFHLYVDLGHMIKGMGCDLRTLKGRYLSQVKFRRDSFNFDLVNGQV